MLPHERSAWSDETGAITLAAKESYRLPTIHDFPDLEDNYDTASLSNGEFEWVDEEWNLDINWSEVDREGWEYCNQRRKWIRHMKLISSTSSSSFKKEQ